VSSRPGGQDNQLGHPGRKYASKGMALGYAAMVGIKRALIALRKLEYLWLLSSKVWKTITKTGIPKASFRHERRGHKS